LVIAIVILQELNAEPVIPEGFPEWKETMDSWGYKMIAAIKVSHIIDCYFIILFEMLVI